MLYEMVGVCVCSYKFKGVYAYVCAHVCMWRPEDTLGIFSQMLPTLCCKTGSLNLPRLSDQLALGVLQSWPS